MSLTTHQIRLIRRWHIWVGLFAVVFLLLLVITGFLLNHSEALGLDKPQIKAQWLTRWYGLKNEMPSQAYSCGNQLLVWANGKWALGQTLLGEDVPQPLGAVEAGGICYIATADALHLFLPDGRLVEKISGKSLPGEPIQALGVSAKRIVLKTATAIYSSEDRIGWRSETANGVSWANRQAVAPQLQQEFADTLVPAISLQKILQDFHSGRIFGRYGALFMDLIGLCLMGLGLSGAWMFWRSLWLRRTLRENKDL